MVLVRSLAYAAMFLGLFAVFIPSTIASGDFQAASGATGPQRWLGLLAMLMGAGVCLLCFVSLAFQGRGTPAVFDPPIALVISGPYRYARNPMYLGYLLIILGEAVWARSVTLLGYAGGMGLGLHLFVVFVEEPGLRRRFGEPYERYCRAVRRWIPGASRSAASG